MKLKLVLFSTACLSFLVIPAAGKSLLAAAAAGKRAVVGAGLRGPVLGFRNWGEPVIIQSQPEAIVVEAVPAPEVYHHQVVVQQPLVQYKSVQPISLVPVATIPSLYSIVTDRLSNLRGGISNAIAVKTRAVSKFLKSLRRLI